MKFFNLGLFHPFMFGIFPILFIYTNNLSEISLDSLLIPILGIFGFISAIILISIKFSKNIQKTTLFLSFLLLLFFSIGYSKLWLNGFNIFDINLDQTGFIFFAYSIIFFVGLISIYKMNYSLEITKIVTVVSFVVILSFLPGIILDFSNTNYNYTNDEKIKFSNLDNPNIYYIILDGYSNNESLKNNFNFDNSKFLKYLENSGFIINKNSFSNYEGTVFSMVSTLNINYLHEFKGLGANTAMLQKNLFSNNLVMNTFQDNGYYTIYVDGGGPLRDMKASDEILCHFTDNGLLQTLIDTSAMTYIFQGFFWDSWNDRRICSFSELENIPSTTESPFFIYAHLRTPHEPFLRDASGNFIEYDKRSDELDEKTFNERYIYQLEYTNKKIIEIIPKLLSTEPKPIIILASDHGTKILTDLPLTDKDLIQKYSNFAAFYVPDSKNSEFYSEITPVNIFRIIFNDYFGNNLEILKNKAYKINDKNTDNYIDQKDITYLFDSKN
tara:strand:+ start:3692 stop:5185 length:1494 start_codon:yes stop_codon:yes gene_type:complete